jgi:hypothetical protein
MSEGSGEANSARGTSSLENELEDSLIGNDVLVEETKQQSKRLLALFKPILGTDRCPLFPLVLGSIVA